VNLLADGRPSAIAISLASINSPFPFLFYLQMGNGRLKDESVLHSLLVECSLRPLIQKPVDYGVTMRFPETEKAEFLAQLSHDHTRDAFVTLLL
jgi:hypothetical protein